VIIALLSDIHANLEALNACIKHAEANGAARFAFLGDLVGYGADAQAVVDVISRRAAGGAVVVKGNHDEAVEKRAGYMNESAQEAIDWARKALGDEAKRFLAGLPLCVRDGQLCLVHASAAFPERWDYVDGNAAARKSIEAAGTAYTFSGHVHEQMLYFQTGVGKIGSFRPVPGTPVPARSHHRWLAMVGSVGQPRDRNPAAAYTLFDARRQEITFYRIPYDHHAAARKIREAGLSETLAYRVEKGI
jgi:diadenosine tetraphosphatase ApaH/serine/threonine PP2A family protein phosphatase